MLAVGDRSKEEMSNTIIPLSNGGDEGTSLWMKAALIAIDEGHNRKVANAKDIDRRTYTSRQHQDYLKAEEVLECEKFRFAQMVADAPQWTEWMG